MAVEDKTEETRNNRENSIEEHSRERLRGVNFSFSLGMQQALQLREPPMDKHDYYGEYFSFR